MATLHVRVVSPEKVVWEGDAASLTAPAWDGKVGILPGHAPMITLLGHGELAVDVPGGGSEESYVAGGVLKVDHDQVTVLTEYAGEAPPEELPPEAVIHPEEVGVWTRYASSGDPLV
jgi:F-type H+-transporting ATPase subunit epsilon